MNDFESLKSQINPKIFLHNPTFFLREFFILQLSYFHLFLQKNINLYKGTF